MMSQQRKQTSHLMKLSLFLSLLVARLRNATSFVSQSCRSHHSNDPLGASNKLFSESFYEDIQQGRIAVVPSFLPPHEVAVLRRDAQALHASNYFSTDALASYGTQGSFDASKDRAVLKLDNWKNHALGDATIRQQLEGRLRTVRQDVAIHLDRPGLAAPDAAATTRFGNGSTEISYTRFGPGAFLRRHVDEHHEELKGAAGWSQPTRRSLSWLVYLNEENWHADTDGGCLRCYERNTAPSHTVGARSNGDLQVGWLRPTAFDPVERPVFLNAQQVGGKCILYRDGDDGKSKIILTDRFSANPILYVAGASFLAQKLLLRQDADRFHLIEPPKSKLNDWFGEQLSELDGSRTLDVPPLAGTLVVFDSVALPHEVLPTHRRERWACSGWMHEDQQSIEGHPDYTTT